MTDAPAGQGAPDAPGGVAVYAHWPYCARICPYCDFNVVRDRGRADEQAALAQAMLADLRAQAAQIGPLPLASIFFGGGTPSLMPPDRVGALIAEARALFPGGGDVEVTLEANPTDAEADRFAALAEAGVNRLSLGVQSLDDAALAFLGRNHSAEEARRAIALAGHAFQRLSIDLIYALPGQTVADWRAALTEAVGLGFEHVSPYQLTLESATAFGRAVRRGTLVPPSEDLAADLYDATQGVLQSHGFEAYEVSNHARVSAARSSHNLHVWRGGDYVGVGPGAHGRLTLHGARTATVAHRKIADYISGVAAGTPWAEVETLDARAAAEEAILLAMRTTEGAPLALLADLGEAVVAAARHLEADGFLSLEQGRVGATEQGRPLLDSLLRILLT